MMVFLAISVLVAVLGVLIALIGRSAGTDRAGWAGALIGIAGLIATVFFGLQAHADSKTSTPSTTAIVTVTTSKSAPPSAAHRAYAAKINSMCLAGQELTDKVADPRQHDNADEVRWTTAIAGILKDLYSAWQSTPYPPADAQQIKAILQPFSHANEDINFALIEMKNEGQAVSQAQHDAFQTQENAAWSKLNDDYKDIDDAVETYGDIPYCRRLFTFN